MLYPPICGLTDDGVPLQVVFAGHPVTVKFTGLLNPFDDPTVMVDIAPLPFARVKVDGLDASVKDPVAGTTSVTVVV